MQNLRWLRWVFVAAIVCLVGCSTFGSDDSRNPIAKGYLVKDDNGDPIYDLHDTPWVFKKYKGQWVVVTYWASYCPPCLAMIPELNALYRGRQGKQAMVLGANYDFVSKAELQAMVKEFNITYPVTRGDPSPKLGITEVDVLPVTVLISPDSRVTAVLRGVQTQVSIENYMRPFEETIEDID